MPFMYRQVGTSGHRQGYGRRRDLSTDTDLFGEPVTRAKPNPNSLRSRLAAWKKAHGVLTHYATHCDEAPWMALLPMAEHKSKKIDEIMAEWASYYDDLQRCPVG